MPRTMPTSNASSDPLPLAFPPLSNTPIIANTMADSVIPDKETTSQHQDPSLESALAPPLNKINLPDIDNNNNKLNLAPLGNNTTELVLRGKNSGNSAIVEIGEKKDKDNEKEINLIRDISSFNWNVGKPLDPPPLACFVSKDNLVQFCQTSGRHHGYAVSKSNSVPGKNVYITCDRSGLYWGSTINKAARNSASMKVNCPFQLEGSVPTSKKVPSKFWTLEIRNGKHNHEPSLGASAHAAHRQLLPAQVEEIRKLSKAKLKPAQILLQL
ncbi:hypothetical protein PCASD_09204 [Puccinia coronata f. sp. avenae]|uniref:FAR1 domain-containing protein n=1 Tax=Puccinia coronata f. sp. avenae TaxID=200324 RepID=A0A2N5TGD3_9BASI|nr:hypothetical protein PCASD_09204 [Puccinia coronata f. sp. avenae]